MAVHSKALPIEECQRLRQVLWSRAQAGKPTSLGRLLLKGGMTTRELRHLLRRGAYLDAVRCDCCGHELPQADLTDRKEYPCPECNALLMAFMPFAKRGQRRRRPSGETDAVPPSGDPPPPDENSEERRKRTQRLKPADVSPIADHTEVPDFAQQTMHFQGVIPIPPKQEPPKPPVVALESTIPYGAEDTTIRFNEVLVVTPGDLPQEQTVGFNQVFNLPSLGEPRSEEETITAFGQLVREEESASANDTLAPFTLPEPDSTAADPKRREQLREQDLNDLHMFESSGLTIRQVGDFRLVNVLGEGSVGQVFLARHPDSRALVALKVLRPEAAADPEYLKRFEREARAAARVQHPNVVRVVGNGIDPDLQLHYLALEYVQGGSLQQVLDDTPKLDETRAVQITRGICLALAAADEQNIVHRDIKPENILMTVDGQPKLADLGLAKHYDDGSQITETGVVVGTPVYISPEQAMGEQDIDIRADLYSLGFCLWQMLSGSLPFADDDAPPLEVIVRHLEQDLPDVRIYAPEISDGVAQIVRGMTERKKERRYRSPLHVVRDIDLVLGKKPPLGSSDTTVPTESAMVRGAAQPVAPSAPSAGSDEHPPAQAQAQPPATASSPSGEKPKAEKKGGSSCCLFIGLLLLLIGVAAAVAAGLVVAGVLEVPDPAVIKQKLGLGG